MCYYIIDNNKMIITLEAITLNNSDFIEHQTEKEFLESYDISKFDRPSVTTDVVIFTIRNEENDNYRRDGKRKLSMLLIKRGEYPYINCWALPGGFLRADETVEECAFRETVEETGICPTSIMPVGTFSEINRDPRGRIISNAFLSIITSGCENIRGGEDAVDAKWFDVEFERNDDGNYLLSLRCGDIVLRAVLSEISKKFGIARYSIIDSGTLAFDHASIIGAALTALRSCIGDFEVAFDFLPEKFTLTQLQCVQETILNVSMLPANFRRKAAEFVEETDEYITGAGHRPAKLYRKKIAI